MISPTEYNHQIRLSDVSFPDLNISGAIFRIQPQYGQIFLSGNQLVDNTSQPVSNINIVIAYSDQVTTYKPIKDAFISNNIARKFQIPTTTSKLTNDSGFITGAALAGYATED